MIDYRMSIEQLQTFFKEVGMAMPKSKETRVGWLPTYVMERPLLHLLKQKTM